MELQTKRLTLRQWKESDRAPFARMNSDPQVMAFFPSIISSGKTDQFIDANRLLLSREGWGSWAVEVTENQEFIGFVGLSSVPAWHPCGGSVDIGWRLIPDYWGQGYATEAAKVALDVGFNDLGLEEIVSYTSACNRPSRAVMLRLNMIKDPIGFEHPRIPEDCELRTHVVYRLTKARWLSK